MHDQYVGLFVCGSFRLPQGYAMHICFCHGGGIRFYETSRHWLPGLLISVKLATYSQNIFGDIYHH